MKLLLVLALFFVLSACGRSSHIEQSYPLPTSEFVTTPPPPEPTTAPISTPQPTPCPTHRPQIRLIPYEPEYIPLIQRWSGGEPFLTEHFLCDFDYLMHTLRLNFPLFGPAYRRFGIDINALAERTRQAITENSITCPHAFSNILATHFFRRIGGFGHLYQHWEARLHLVLANIYRYSMDPYGNFIHAYSQRIYEVMRADAAIRFYGYINVDLGEYEAGMVDPHIITTSIMVPGEVAYVNVRGFSLYNLDHDRDIIFAFYEEIAGFDHLIIDLRQNLGGFAEYFYELFVFPNLTTRLEGSFYEFFSAGHNNRIYADALIGDYLAADPGSLTFHYNAAEFIAENSMPYFNEDDLTVLHNAIAWNIQIDPHVTERAFEGRIWVLIGPNTQSGAEVASIFIRETGFASLVGEPTAGIMGAISAYKLLPNSGILVRYDLGYMTDSYGRSFEEFGVQPHYFNLPGMNALETVLELIR